MAARIPGPICQETRPQYLDRGTLCLAASPVASSSGGRCHALWQLDQALAALQASAQNFAWRFIRDANARSTYVQRIAQAAAELRADVVAGRVGAAEGAALAVQTRNTILEEVRAITSAIGKAGAQSIKPQGMTLDDALQKAAEKLFPGRHFADLNVAQKRQVFNEVIEASGRSKPRITGQIPKWTRIGRGLAVVTIAISVYNIWEAQNKLRQSAKEGATLIGGALGGAAANASAGFLCGPGAPICVTALFVIGGVAGAIVAGMAADEVLDQREIVGWLGG